MNVNEMRKELSRKHMFSLKPLPIQGLLRPSCAVKIIFHLFTHKFFNISRFYIADLFFNEKMLIKLPEHVSIMIYLHHFFEYNLTSILLSCLKEKMVFVDVGSHYGYFSLLASKLVGDVGKVYSFEPTPDSFKVLEKNVMKKKNIITNNLGMWSKKQTIDFYDYGDELSSYNSFTRPRIDNYDGKGKKIYVDTTTIDDFFNNQPVDFIKIDAESAELEILNGMKKTIEEKHPMITIEVGDGIKEYRSRTCIDYLLDKNYGVYEFQDGKIVPHSPTEKYSYENLLFMWNQ